MGKLRILSGREVCAILVQHGFVRVRQRGSHVVMQKRTTRGTITVPVPDHRVLRATVARHSSLPIGYIQTAIKLIRHLKEITGEP